MSRSPIIKQLKQLMFVKKELAKVDLSLVTASQDKEPYEMSFPEFKATFIKAAFEETSYGKHGNVTQVLYKAWHTTVLKAIIELRPKVAIQSLDHLRFRQHMKEVRKYARHYQLHLD